MTGQRQSRKHNFLAGLLAIGALIGVYCVATVGVSSLAIGLTDISAQARGRGGGHGGVHGGHRGGGMHAGRGMRGGHVARGGRGVRGGRVVGRGGVRGGPYRVGGRYYGGVWYGHARRWYGGRWWPYGVGSCWALSPIGYVWICD